MSFSLYDKVSDEILSRSLTRLKDNVVREINTLPDWYPKSLMDIAELDFQSQDQMISKVLKYHDYLYFWNYRVILGCRLLDLHPTNITWLYRKRYDRVMEELITSDQLTPIYPYISIEESDQED
jgi:hypothetical protein